MWTIDEASYWMSSRKAGLSLERKREVCWWEGKHWEDVEGLREKDSRTQQEN